MLPELRRAVENFEYVVIAYPQALALIEEMSERMVQEVDRRKPGA